MRRSLRLRQDPGDKERHAEEQSARPVRSIRLHLRSTADSDQAAAATHTGPAFPHPTCPVCDKLILGDASDVNEHIDDCINGRGPEQPDTASSLSSGLFHRTTSMINIDDDYEHGHLYGRVQYTEADVQRVLSAAVDYSVSDAHDQLNLQGLLHSILTSHDATLYQLRRLLQSLLEQANAGAKCAVCLETLRMPAAVSAVCWHVLCEGCWLRQIGTTKSLCPQCSSIVSLSDLRRIYF